MTWTGLARLAVEPRGLIGVGVVAAMGIVAFVLRPVLPGLGNLNLLIFFVGFLGACVVAGVPIAFSFGLATVGYLMLTTRLPMAVVVNRMDEGMSHLILLAVPLFVLLGGLIDLTGMGRAMVGCLGALFGHVRGGLSYVLVAAMYLVSGISGAKAADMAAVAPVLLPEMERRGGRRGDLLALLAATGAQTETVPPSIVLITIGSVTGISISTLFEGGLLPALVLGACLCSVVWWRHRKDGSVSQRADGQTIRRAFVLAVPALLLPFLIRAAVIGGVATATEVSTIGIAYSVFVGVFVYRSFDLRRLRPILVETASLSGAILMIVGAATGMGWALTQSGFSSSLAAFLGGLPGGGWTFLAVSALAFVLLGSLLEGIPAIVLFGPLMFPIARQLGIDDVHYAMVVVLAMGIGLFAPPFGVGYYAAAAIARIRPDEGMRPIVGYLLALAVGLAIVTAFPVLTSVGAR
jgi:tripartite ATP-independent transporter DctM subunit